jgi:hypothetical protein
MEHLTPPPVFSTLAEVDMRPMNDLRRGMYSILITACLSMILAAPARTPCPPPHRSQAMVRQFKHAIRKSALVNLSLYYT